MPFCHTVDNGLNDGLESYWYMVADSKLQLVLHAVLPDIWASILRYMFVLVHVQKTVRMSTDAALESLIHWCHMIIILPCHICPGSTKYIGVRRWCQIDPRVGGSGEGLTTVDSPMEQYRASDAVFTHVTIDSFYCIHLPWIPMV